MKNSKPRVPLQDQSKYLDNRSNIYNGLLRSSSSGIPIPQKQSEVAASSIGGGLPTGHRITHPASIYPVDQVHPSIPHTAAHGHLHASHGQIYNCDYGSLAYHGHPQAPEVHLDSTGPIAQKYLNNSMALSTSRKCCHGIPCSTSNCEFCIFLSREKVLRNISRSLKSSNYQHPATGGAATIPAYQAGSADAAALASNDVSFMSVTGPVEVSAPSTQNLPLGQLKLNSLNSSTVVNPSNLEKNKLQAIDQRAQSSTSTHNASATSTNSYTSCSIGQRRQYSASSLSTSDTCSSNSICNISQFSNGLLVGKPHAHYITRPGDPSLIASHFSQHNINVNDGRGITFKRAKTLNPSAEVFKKERVAHPVSHPATQSGQLHNDSQPVIAPFSSAHPQPYYIERIPRGCRPIGLAPSQFNQRQPVAAFEPQNHTSVRTRVDDFEHFTAQRQEHLQPSLLATSRSRYPITIGSIMPPNQRLARSSTYPMYSLMVDDCSLTSTAAACCPRNSTSAPSASSAAHAVTSVSQNLCFTTHQALQPSKAVCKSLSHQLASSLDLSPEVKSSEELEYSDDFFKDLLENDWNLFGKKKEFTTYKAFIAERSDYLRLQNTCQSRNQALSQCFRRPTQTETNWENDFHWDIQSTKTAVNPTHDTSPSIASLFSSPVFDRKTNIEYMFYFRSYILKYMPTQTYNHERLITISSEAIHLAISYFDYYFMAKLKSVGVSLKSGTAGCKSSLTTENLEKLQKQLPSFQEIMTYLPSACVYMSLKYIEINPLNKKMMQDYHRKAYEKFWDKFNVAPYINCNQVYSSSARKKHNEYAAIDESNLLKVERELFETLQERLSHSTVYNLVEFLFEMDHPKSSQQNIKHVKQREDEKQSRECLCSMIVTENVVLNYSKATISFAITIIINCLWRRDFSRLHTYHLSNRRGTQEVVECLKDLIKIENVEKYFQQISPSCSLEKTVDRWIRCKGVVRILETRGTV